MIERHAFHNDRKTRRADLHQLSDGCAPCLDPLSFDLLIGVRGSSSCTFHRQLFIRFSKDSQKDRKEEALVGKLMDLVDESPTIDDQPSYSNGKMETSRACAARVEE